MYIQINILSVLVYTALLFLACDDTPPLNPVFYFWNLVGFFLRYRSNENIFLFLFLGITKKKGARIPEIHRRSRKPISFCSSASRRGNIRRWCRKTIGKCRDSATRPAGHCTQQECDNIQIRSKVKYVQIHLSVVRDDHVGIDDAWSVLSIGAVLNEPITLFKHLVYYS